MIIEDIKDKKETLWINESLDETLKPRQIIKDRKFVHVEAAQNRLMRFMPFIERAFPETAPRKGIIESDLIKIPELQKYIESKCPAVKGTFYLKDDAHLPIAGSVKARGGIHEVLKIAEQLAISKGLMKVTDDHSVMDSEEFKNFFGEYTIEVGSTGNLGISIGMMGRALGFNVVVHMSRDAAAWKKDLLRSKGAYVKEYDSDYTEAVSNGRKESKDNPKSFFIDDENSENLFFGYSTAALRLKVQLMKKGIQVNGNHPLFVYIPCGVGGAPGGITFGLKELFGKDVHCFFGEPTEAPSFMLGMNAYLSDKDAFLRNGNVLPHCKDIGIEGDTIADGLNVGRASKFVVNMMETLVSGSYTILDEDLLEYQRALKEKEGIFAEPSACASLKGPEILFSKQSGIEYLNKLKEEGTDLNHITHILWSTGGGLLENMM